MGKLAECESYKNYLISKNNAEINLNNKKQAMNNRIKTDYHSINALISSYAESGKYKIEYIIDSRNMSFKTVKNELKKIYINEGYKVKVRYIYPKKYGKFSKYKIIISWKHWKRLEE